MAIWPFTAKGTYLPAASAGDSEKTSGAKINIAIATRNDFLSMDTFGKLEQLKDIGHRHGLLETYLWQGLVMLAAALRPADVSYYGC